MLGSNPQTGSAGILKASQDLAGMLGGDMGPGAAMHLAYIESRQASV